MGVTLRLAPPVRGILAIFRHDFFPSLGVKIRRFVFHPIGIISAAGCFSLLCGVMLNGQTFVLSGAVLLILCLGVLWPWLCVRGLSGSVSFDRERVTEGETVETRLTLRNRLPWAARGLAVRGGFPGATESETVAAIAAVPRRTMIRCRWSFTPAGRGIYPLGAAGIFSGFPFGLRESGRELPAERPLIVWPRTYPVGPIPPVSGVRTVEGNVSRGRVGSNGDVAGVRPYRRGDSPRRIHWAQSARQDRLIVCELESNARPVIQIVLDADPRAHVGSGPDSSLAWAVRIVASLAKGWLEEGAEVGLAWGAGDLSPASGSAQIRRILDALAGIPDDAGRPLAEALACPKCRGFRDGLQVIVATDRTHAHGGCGACEAENQRWVILRTAAFAADGAVASCGHCPEAWLSIDSKESIPVRLRGGWREARHGS